MTTEIQYAVIHIKHGPAESWPVVERVPGGWQSGVHHYPDSDVRGVTPLSLAPPGDVVVQLPEPTAVHVDPTGDRTWNVPVPGSYWDEVCVTSSGPHIPRIQISGAAQFTPDVADRLADALRAAAADARHRFTTSPAESG